MKINLASDIHFEFYTDHGIATLINLLSQPHHGEYSGIDALILAGDIQLLSYFESYKAILEIFCDHFPYVILVPGNHEYYDEDIIEAQLKLKELEAVFGNLYILEPQKAVIIKNQRFLGGTMWFPDLPTNIMYKRGLNDFKCIKNLEPFIYEHNQKLTDWLKEELTTEDIVITHHLPSYQSISGDYVGSNMNCFYMTNQENLILDKQPKLWLHGHSHDPVDYMIDQTRVISNPIGYPHQGALNQDSFWKIIEI